MRGPNVPAPHATFQRSAKPTMAKPTMAKKKVRFSACEKSCRLSAYEDSCCPPIARNVFRGDGSWIKMDKSAKMRSIYDAKAKPQNKVHSVNAVARNEDSASIAFQVGGVRKPLESAAEIIESNNRVALDPNGRCIENKTSNKRWPLKGRGGTFMFDVTIEGQKESITLDSGAAISVCPEGWGGSAVVDSSRKHRMMAANGAPIESNGSNVARFHGRVEA